MTKNATDYSQWSALWDRGYITTFGPTMPLNYGSDVKAFWHKQFQKLNNSAEIIDVAAGNGAVATIAAEYSSIYDKKFSIAAADAAEINPELITESESLNKYRCNVDFYSNAPCEKLPFENNSADLICSQFGIEYSDLSKSIPEVKRILRTNGTFAAVMHHESSSVIRKASKELDVLKDALHSQKIIIKLNQYFNAIGQVSDEAALNAVREKPAVIKSFQKLGKVINYLQSKYPNSNSVNRIMSEIEGLKPYVFKSKEERKSAIKEVSNDLEMTVLRQNDLKLASISTSSMRELRDIAESSGFKGFSSEEIRSPDGDISGWKVVATV